MKERRRRPSFPTPRGLPCVFSPPFRSTTKSGTSKRSCDEVRRYSPHILVVNDGSTDRTAGAAGPPGRACEVVTHPKNRGYGAALISAFAYALAHDFDVLVTMDCDGQHEPARIPVLLEAIHDADIVSGSRYLRDFRQDTAGPAGPPPASTSRSPPS